MKLANKIRREILLQVRRDVDSIVPGESSLATDEQVERAYLALVAAGLHQAHEHDFWRGQCQTPEIKLAPSRRQLCRVARQLSDGSWVGWVKQNGVELIDAWMERAYELECIEGEDGQSRTFSRKETA